MIYRGGWRVVELARSIPITGCDVWSCGRFGFTATVNAAEMYTGRRLFTFFRHSSHL